jgi:hypothetical protein
MLFINVNRHVPTVLWGQQHRHNKLYSHTALVLYSNELLQDIQNYNFACCLYGRETWSLALREERRLRVFENWVLRGKVGAKRDKVTGEWRKLHNEELNDLYCLPNILRVIKSRRMRWAGHVVQMREERGVYTVLVGKPEGRRPVGRPRRRWKDNIRMELQEVGCGGMDWIGIAQGRNRWQALVNAAMNLRVP